MKNYLYIVLLGGLYGTFAVVMNFFPRSTYSELEKRDLAEFPAFTLDSLADGSFTSAVSSWYSDSEPFRDEFMLQSMLVKDAEALVLSEDNIRIIAPAVDSDSEDDAEDAPIFDDAMFPDTLTVDAYAAPALEDGVAKMRDAGIIVIGSVPNVRALMSFHAKPTSGGGFARSANLYKQTFGDAVNVYCMPVPLSTEYYCPPEAQKYTSPQAPVINNVFSLLEPGVKPVDVYSVLAKHTAEDIYLRTDHHWAPLGAYYAAQKFAEVAGVPFPDLSAYKETVLHGYVGSMFGYSKDVSVKNSPEDFHYYMPTGVTYKTTYINYYLDKEFGITGESKPTEGSYFRQYKDGSGGMYCTFMGGDQKLTKVETSTGNGRRLMVIKDSFGNAVPGYLFYSFEQVHVVDFRYFQKNMVAYVEENGITDILFVSNMMNVVSSSVESRYRRFLTQRSGDLDKVRAAAAAAAAAAKADAAGAGAAADSSATVAPVAASDSSATATAPSVAGSDVAEGTAKAAETKTAADSAAASDSTATGAAPASLL